MACKDFGHIRQTVGSCHQKPWIPWGYWLGLAVALFVGLVPGRVSAVAGAVAADRGAAPVAVVDDTGRTIALPRAATRVVALSPALVEMVFELGAGQRLVGAVAHSDWPDEARTIPRVGDALMLNLEAILALQPDLILAWEGGNLAAPLDRLAALGIPVYRSRIARLEDIGTTLARLEQLLGLARDDVPRDSGDREVGLREKVVRDGGTAGLAHRFASRLAGIRPAHAGPPVRVFYQVWDTPVMTINGRHVISDAIARCGGVNVFADALPVSPTVSVEAVVAAAPELIIGSGTRADGSDGGQFDVWRRFPAIPAVAAQRLVLIPADRVSRPTSRMLEAAEAICAAIAAARR